jgi:hypothetical protein
MIRRLPSRKVAKLIERGDYIAVVQVFNGLPRNVAVPVGGSEHAAALDGRDGWSMPPLADYSEDAATYADVMHDDGGMVAAYDLLESQTALWAAHMPVGTPRSEARRYMLACMDALAERMRETVEGIIADDIALPWGVECDECDAADAGGEA